MWQPHNIFVVGTRMSAFLISGVSVRLIIITTYFAPAGVPSLPTAGEFLLARIMRVKMNL